MRPDSNVPRTDAMQVNERLIGRSSPGLYSASPDESNPHARWYAWLLPAFLVGLCIVLVVTA